MSAPTGPPPTARRTLDEAWAAVAADGTDALTLAGAVAALHGRAPSTALGDHETPAAAQRAWRAAAAAQQHGAPSPTATRPPGEASARAARGGDPGRTVPPAAPARVSDDASSSSRGPAPDVRASPAPVLTTGWAAAGDAVRRWQARGVRAAVVGDPAYPERLAAGFPFGVPPPWLAWRGDASVLDGRPSLAIVGARRATSYGTGVAAWLARAVGEAGGLVVSGGAVGIDGAAHEAALDTVGGTAVVLGCGHDVPYPRPHAGPGRLFDRVVGAGGVVLSEVEPTEPALPGRVLARNRIVAALVDVLVVVEGSGRSGTLRTATEAAERGVTVLAVPGDVRKPLSVAPNRLLTEGAVPATCPDDVLAHLDLDVPVRSEPSRRDRRGGMPAPLHAVLADAWPRARRVDQLVARSRLSVGEVLAALTAARVAGVVVDAADGYRLARAPASGPG